MIVHVNHGESYGAKRLGANDLTQDCGPPLSSEAIAWTNALGNKAETIEHGRCAFRRKEIYPQRVVERLLAGRTVQL